MKGTTFGDIIGVSEAPLSRGRIAPLGTNATRPVGNSLVPRVAWRAYNIPDATTCCRKTSWSSTKSTNSAIS